MLLAVAAGVLGLISNAVVTLVDGIENRALEHQKSEATMILEALKTGDADEAAQNLNLLVETGLVTQHKAELTAYLKSHKIDGAVLPSALGSAAQERSAAKATSQQISAETAGWKAFCLKGIVSEDIQLCTFDTQQACDEYLKSARGPLMRNHTCVAKPAAVSCYLMTRPGRPDRVECYADLTRCAASAQRVLTSTATGSPEEVCTEYKLAN